jgi:hypothetical protein
MATLLRLHDWGCLTAPELRQLARLLWARVNERTGLPDTPGVQNFVYLSLPEPRGVRVVERFRKYLREGDVLRFCQQTTGPGGAVQRSFTGYMNPDAYILSWLGATDVPSSTDARRRNRRFLDWTRAEAVTLFRKLQSWWTEEGRDLLGGPTGSPFIDQLSVDPLHERIDHIFEALERIVIPRVRVGSRLATEVIAFVREIESCNVPVEAVLPALLRLEPQSEKATAAQLRRSLGTHEEERLRAALRGLTSWLRNQPNSPGAMRGYRLPRVPEDLLQELGSRVAGRRQPGLRHTIAASISVVQNSPERVNRRFIQSLTVGLGYLISETQYRTEDDAPGQIPAAETPTYRLLTTRLASLLAQIPGGRSEVIDQWLEAAQQDPLPEIRREIGDVTDVEDES